MTNTTRAKYIYGPVKSWRTGTSLGIDPIGATSTCSFNCVYCQLGQIQNISSAIKTYVPTAQLLEDLEEFHELGIFRFEDLDVITFAGSGEPTLAANLDEMIETIRDFEKKVYLSKAEIPQTNKLSKISILSNATMLNDEGVRRKAAHADLVSLKLDAATNKILSLINQPAAGISIESILSGIQKFKSEYSGDLQLQIMFMPKYLALDAGDLSSTKLKENIGESQYLQDLAQLIIQTGINKIQINTPMRPKPLGKEYHIETRANHKADDLDYATAELPVIEADLAFAIEDYFIDKISPELGPLEIINVYQRNR